MYLWNNSSSHASSHLSSWKVLTFVPDTLPYQLFCAGRERCNVTYNSQWPILCAAANVSIRRRTKHGVGWRIDGLPKNSICKYPLIFHFVLVLVKSSIFVVLVRILFLEQFLLRIMKLRDLTTCKLADFRWRPGWPYCPRLYDIGVQLKGSRILNEKIGQFHEPIILEDLYVIFKVFLTETTVLSVEFVLVK